MLHLTTIQQTEALSQVQALYQACFQTLLDKYQDFETNPANEKLESIINKFNMEDNKFYFIIYKNETVGMVRVIVGKHAARIAPICILPDFQGKGLAYNAMLETERLYPKITKWQLETIQEEPHLVKLYQKLGYQLTGKIEKMNDSMSLVYFEKNK
ncbi:MULTISPECIES: GNAT family N-acetyltransferase [unclassified Enterococcus]|uniref:GNAT family N-acetyltransferase n=1 Tax=unclassified Enterococcus TaxID=2608891 RepID=UPI001555F83A|nr:MULTISPECIES: GNAT family N-acetyltransferase [unclassified Enterococcus]MBS7576479.1 GNAT family N-acetyltransferase [Enterococcus sp. MMGLQ5-2]MBS7583711.1 GNAT family N-acetyltransferase [Enterococcus sp. MMGLQ5-1]NPD11572.1 GNAT family N-acetyltransferase [Enterococcus sp. MMGLQ5-1]NPD36316.1 GNAT family N-acetyltransferase [Enterococcus sp. MMGLQ5-2]